MQEQRLVVLQNNNMKKKIYFVNGALGSGKTTLINQLILSGKLGKFFIVENEVSSFSVDNMCLHVDPKQMKVFAGECICCSDPKELVKILEKVAEEDYDNVVIESSGVTSLNQLLAKLLTEDKLQSQYEIGGCVFLVDALGITRTNTNDLELADFVIVTKYDQLKNFAQHEGLDKFIKEEYSDVAFQIKENLDDARWIDKLLKLDIKSFRDWSLKVNDKKHHGQNFVQVIFGDRLLSFNPDRAYSLMKEKEIYRVKGFWQKNGLVYHIEATPELLDVKVSVEPVAKLGVVVIGGNKLLQDEFIRQVI